MDSLFALYRIDWYIDFITRNDKVSNYSMCDYSKFNHTIINFGVTKIRWDEI